MKAEVKFTNLEQGKKTPSAVFYLVDDFAKEIPSGQITVSIEGMDVKPVRNSSGYYIFFKLPEIKLAFVIKAEGFADRMEEIEIEAGRPAIRTIKLIPLPSYPFPNGATLLRGTILENGTNNPVEGVKVELTIKGGVKRAVTTEKGEFVIYLPRLKENMLKKANGKYFVKGDNDATELAAVFTSDGYVYVDNKIILIKDGGEEEIDTFSLEAGKTAIIKKYLKKGG